MYDVYQRLEKLIAGLRASNRVRIPRGELRYHAEAVDPALLADLRREGFDVDIEELYRQVEFVDLRWASADDAGWTFIDDDTDLVGGGLNVPAFASFASRRASRAAFSTGGSAPRSSRRTPTPSHFTSGS